MNLPIVQSILHGELRPNIAHNIDYRDISNALTTLPEKLPDIEQLFISKFPLLSFDFESERPFYINGIAPDSYTPINDNVLSKHFELPIPKPSSPKEKFYRVVVNAEIQRLKLAIVNFAQKQHSDIDTRSTIKDTLKQILLYCKNINDTYEPILSTLKVQLLCFYVELSAMASNIMKENEDFLSFEDLMFEVFHHYPKDNETSAYQTFVDSFKTNDSIFPAAKTELPSSEEYEREQVQTNYEIFVQEVEKYRFAELDKVKSLAKTKQSKLIYLITSHDSNYAVPMLVHIGYFDKLKKEFNMSNAQVFKHWSKALQKSERAIKGNFNAMNPKSKEDSYRYNSADFIQTVASDYENLLT